MSATLSFPEPATSHEYLLAYPYPHDFATCSKKYLRHLAVACFTIPESLLALHSLYQNGD
jgi:hypothetical protein